jgi:hypothetical protein
MPQWHGAKVCDHREARAAGAKRLHRVPCAWAVDAFSNATLP